MRYIVSARIIPGKAAALEQALQEGSFGRGFPFGDLGDNLRACSVGPDGTLRWTETCYCREYSDAALDMELEYFQPYLHAMEIADARDPRYCKGYPHCNDCDCTRTIGYPGMPLMEYLKKISDRDGPPQEGESVPTRWTGWRGKVQTQEEARRNTATLNCVAGLPCTVERVEYKNHSPKGNM